MGKKSKKGGIVIPVSVAPSGSTKEVEKYAKDVTRRMRKIVGSASISAKISVDSTKAQKEVEAVTEKTDKLTTSANKASKALDTVVSGKGKSTPKSKSGVSGEMNNIDGKLKNINSQFSLTESYLGRLMVRTAAYFSLRMVGGFLNGIREITAEFELQRVALGAILQDTHKAGVLFESIKKTAVKSPFEVQQLTAYTKQLAAFKISSDELFDTTMQLADISAGLGVDMERLILAYGQVKAASVLRGQELRQFTEAGIPLVEELAKKFSELRGETVSTAEVFTLISERAVSFGMVKEIFDDMTAAGGMFYKMQEKQAETLKGKWTNLKDAYSIMKDEIGRTDFAQGFMYTLIDAGKFIAENWQKVGRIITTVSAAMVTLGINSILLSRYTRVLTAEEAKLAVADGSLNQKMVIRGKSLSILNKRQMAANVAMAKYNVLMVKAATTSGIFKAALLKLSAGLMSLQASLGPAGFIVMGLTAIISLFQAFRKEKHTLADIISEAQSVIGAHTSVEKDTEQMKNLIDSYEELSQKTGRSADETKRLVDMTETLAKAFPNAIDKINGVGDSIVMNTDKMREILKVQGDNYRQAIQNKIDELKKAQAETAKELGSYSASGGQLYKKKETGVSVTVVRGKELDKFFELNAQARELSSTISDLENILNPSQKQPAMLLEGWRLDIFNLGKVTKETGEEFTAYSEEVMQNFTSVQDALKDVAEQWKNINEMSQAETKALASSSLSEDTRRSIEREKALHDFKLKVYYNILQKYNALDLLNDKKKSTDPRIAQLRQELKDVQDIYKKYLEFRESLGEGDARKKIEEISGDVTEIDFLDPLSYKARLTKILHTIQELSKTIKREATNIAGEDFTEELDSSVQDMIDETLKIVQDVDWSEFSKAIEKRLKNLSEAISNSTSAQNFYKDILGKTADATLAEQLTESVFGGLGRDLTKKFKEQVEEVFGPRAMSAWDAATGSFNWAQLEGLIDDSMSEKMQEQAKGIVSAGKKAQMELYKQWTSELKSEQSVMDKRIQLYRETNERIREIESDSQIDSSIKDDLIRQYKGRRDKLEAEYMYEAFKEGGLYVQLFNNLDNASYSMLKRMKEGLESVRESFKDLSPQDLKELQSKIQSVDEAIAKRNPFKALSEALEKYRALSSSKSYKKAVKDASAAEVKKNVAEKNLLKSVQERQQIEMFLMDVENGLVDASEEEVSAAREKLALAVAYENVNKQNLNNAQDELDVQNNIVQSWQELFNTYGSIAEGFGTFINSLHEISDILFEIRSAYVEAGSAQAEYISDLKKATDEMISGAGKLVTGISQISSKNYVEGITNVAVGAYDIVKGIVDKDYAKKNREINVSIEEQTKKVDALTYSMSRLDSAMEEAFGAERVEMLRSKIVELQASAEAYATMAGEESKKGKKSDSAKVKEYEEKAREIRDQISGMKNEMADYLLGTDITSAAREFADAWLDAYSSFGDTVDAIQSKFSDMMKNMVVESIMAKAIEKWLEPIYKEIDASSGTTEGMTNAIAFATKYMNDNYANLDTMMQGFSTIAENLGVSLRDSSSGLSGISRDIASASEESILGLAAGINTQNFYMSGIYSSVNDILSIMMGNAGSVVNSSDISNRDYTTQIDAISQNTADILSECRSMMAAINSVISTPSGSAQKRICVKM